MVVDERQGTSMTHAKGRGGDDAGVIVIGAGYWGKNLVRNFHDLGALRGVCEEDVERRLQFAEKYPDATMYASFDEVLDAGVGAVSIATPAETHGPLVRRALEADLDVLVEKPLCLSVAEGEELVALARERGRVLMVGHLLWYHPAVLALQKLISDGELGRIEYIYSNRLNLGKIRREENILWSFAPHDISVILGLLREAPVQVSAFGAAYLHERIADVTVSHLAFASGVRSHIFVSWLHPFKEQKLVVVGDRKMAVFNDVAPEDKLVLYPHNIVWKNQVPVAEKAEAEPVPLEKGEPLRAECEHFLECVRTRQAPRTDGQEGLRVLRVLDACEQSLGAGTGEAVDLLDGGAGAPAGAVAASGAGPDYFVHETSVVDEDVEIGKGTKIWHFSHVQKGARIGEGCSLGQNVLVGPGVRIGDGVKIQNNVSVYAGVTLGDHVFCGPSMVFTNVINPRSEIRRMDELLDTPVGDGATLGANCTIVCGHEVGRYAFVGAGAVVTKDVPEYALVLGNPARIAGWMCRCGNRIDFPEDGGPGRCRACETEYERTAEGVREVGAGASVG
jgi:UDP-2-acetamido-3-amino-2,3-dideoxy-glucuronate N-acetyltransferase